METNVIKRKLAFLMLGAVLTASAGCSKQHHIYVESDGCWSGTVDSDQYINGCGNSSYKVLGSLKCVQIEKSGTRGTYLRVRIDEGAWASTPDTYGVIQVCD